VGRTPLHGGTFTEEALVGVAKFMRGTTLYEIVGDVPWWLGAIAIFGMAFVTRERAMRAIKRS
jgi:apolipoprotein N-acyltransferase